MIAPPRSKRFDGFRFGGCRSGEARLVQTAHAFWLRAAGGSRGEIGTGNVFERFAHPVFRSRVTAPTRNEATGVTERPVAGSDLRLRNPHAMLFCKRLDLCS